MRCVAGRCVALRCVASATALSASERRAGRAGGRGGVATPNPGQTLESIDNRSRRSIRNGPREPETRGANPERSRSPSKTGIVRSGGRRPGRRPFPPRRATDRRKPPGRNTIPATRRGIPSRKAGLPGKLGAPTRRDRVPSGPRIKSASASYSTFEAASRPGPRPVEPERPASKKRAARTRTRTGTRTGTGEPPGADARRRPFGFERQTPTPPDPDPIAARDDRSRNAAKRPIPAREPANRLRRARRDDPTRRPRHRTRRAFATRAATNPANTPRSKNDEPDELGDRIRPVERTKGFSSDYLGPGTTRASPSRRFGTAGANPRHHNAPRPFLQSFFRLTTRLFAKIPIPTTEKPQPPPSTRPPSPRPRPQ